MPVVKDQFIVQVIVDSKGALVGFKDLNGQFLRLDRNVESANTSMQGFNNSVVKSAAAVTAMNQSIGVLRSVIGGIESAFSRTAGASAKFERKIAEIFSLVSDNSVLMPELTQNVEELAIAFGRSPEEVATAYYQSISSGATTAAEANVLLNDAFKLAIAGQASAEKAVDALTTTFLAYGEKAGTAKNITDGFTIAMQKNRTTVGALAKNLPRLTGTAALLGVEFNELISALATIANVAPNTDEAAIRLRQILAGLAKTKAVRVFKTLGEEVNTAEKAIGKLGLVGTLQLLRDQTDGTTAGMQLLFEDVSAIQGISNLTGALIGKFRENLEALEEAGKNAGEATDKAFQKMLTTQFKIDQQTQRVQVAFFALGRLLEDTFLKTITMIADAFVEFASRLELLSEQAKLLEAVMAGLAATVAITASQLIFSGAAASGFLGVISSLAGWVLTLSQRLVGLTALFVVLDTVMRGPTRALGLMIDGFTILQILWRDLARSNPIAGAVEGAKDAILDFFGAQEKTKEGSKEFVAKILEQQLAIERYNKGMDELGKNAALNQLISQLELTGEAVKKFEETFTGIKNIVKDVFEGSGIDELNKQVGILKSQLLELQIANAKQQGFFARAAQFQEKLDNLRLSNLEDRLQQQGLLNAEAREAIDIARELAEDRKIEAIVGPVGNALIEGAQSFLDFLGTGVKKAAKDMEAEFDLPLSPFEMDLPLQGPEMQGFAPLLPIDTKQLEKLEEAAEKLRLASEGKAFQGPFIPETIDFTPEFLKISEDMPKTLKESLLEGSQKLLNFSAGLPDMAIKAAEKMQRMFGTAFEIGALAFEGAFNAVVGLFSPDTITKLSDFAESMTNLPQELTNAFFSLIDNLDAFIANFSSAFTELINDLPALFQSILDKLPEIITKALDAFEKIIDILPDLFDRLFQKLPELIQIILDRLPDIITNLLNAIGDIISNLIMALPDIIIAILDKLPLILERLIQGLLENIDKIALTFVSVLIDKGPDIAIALVKAVVKLAPAIGRAIARSIATSINRLFTGFEVKGAGEILQFPDKVGEATETFTKAIRGETNELFSVLTTGRVRKEGKAQKTAIEKVAAVIQPVAKKVPGIFKRLFDGIMDNFGNIILGPLGALLKLFGVTISFEDMMNGLTKIVSGVGKFFAGILSGVGDVMGPILGGLNDVLGGVVAGLGSGINDVFTGLFSAIFEDGIGPLLSGLGEGVSGLISGIGNTFGAAVQTISDFIELIKLFIEIMRAAGQFLIDGLGDVLSVENISEIFDIDLNEQMGMTDFQAKVDETFSFDLGEKLNAEGFKTKVKEAFDPVIKYFKEKLSGDVTKAFENAANKVIEILNPVFDAIKPVFTALTDMLNNFKVTFQTQIQPVFDGLKGALQTVLGPFEKLADALKNPGKIFENIGGGGGGDGKRGPVTGIPGSPFAKGGAVRETMARFQAGGSVGTDTVPALLTPGEFVLNRDAVSGIGTDAASFINQTGTLPNRTTNINIGEGAIVISEAGEQTGADIADTVLDELKRRSLNGEFVMSEEGLRTA